VFCNWSCISLRTPVDSGTSLVETHVLVNCDTGTYLVQLQYIVPFMIVFTIAYLDHFEKQLLYVSPM
jgi:ABC-type spermidine/putrescine transport system permease subunit I